MINSDKGEEARKKAKTDFVYDFSKFTHPSDFCEYYDGVSPEDPYIAWMEYENSLREKIGLREIHLFLKSQGREAEAMEIQSLNDQRVCEIKDSWDFNEKGWILRLKLGPYTDYQHLYVDDFIIIDDAGELYGQYCDLYCTRAIDSAFVDFFEELQTAITWDMNSRDAHKRVHEISKNYSALQLETLRYSIKEILYLKHSEQKKKESVPFFPKLWQEIVEKERNAVDVLVHIKDNDGALYPLFVRSIVSGLRKKERPNVLQILEDLKSRMQVAPKDEDLEDQIYKYFHPAGELCLLEHMLHMPKKSWEFAAKFGLE